MAGADAAGSPGRRVTRSSGHRGRHERQKAGAYEPVLCYNVLVNGTLSWRRTMQLVTLLPTKVLMAMALAQSVRWSLQNWREHRVLDQFEPIPGQTVIDNLKMASAVIIAAAVMIPAILAYAFIAWLIRTLSSSSGREKLLVGTSIAGVPPRVFD